MSRRSWFHLLRILFRPPAAAPIYLSRTRFGFTGRTSALLPVSCGDSTPNPSFWKHRPRLFPVLRVLWHRRTSGCGRTLHQRSEFLLQKRRFAFCDVILFGYEHRPTVWASLTPRARPSRSAKQVSVRAALLFQHNLGGAIR